MERLSELEKWRIAGLSAPGLPSRLIGKEIGRHHRTVWGHISRLRRPTCGSRCGRVAVVVDGAGGDLAGSGRR